MRGRSVEPWVFAAACVAVAFVGQGARGLYETDEGRYAECARIMADTGDWIVPRLQGRPHLTKPPGTYWAIAAGIEIFGHTDFAVRCLLGASFAAAAVAVRSAARSILGDAAAAARAGWIYLAMLYPFLAGSVLTTDSFHVAFGTIAAATAAASLRSARPGNVLLAAGAALSLAAFCKGPLAWLPFAGFAAGFYATRRSLHPGRHVVSFPLLLLAPVALALWLLLLEQRVPGSLETIFVREGKERLTTSGDHEPKPFWWFVPILLAGALPFWTTLVRAVRRTFATWREPGTLWPLLWFAVPFLAHSAAPPKNWLYVLGCSAPLAILLARAAKDPASPWPARPGLLLLWIALLLGGRHAVTLVPNTKDMHDLARAVERADPSGRLPVALLSGRDLHGLYFYRSGDLVHLDAPRVRTSRADANWYEFLSARGIDLQPWILVSEWGDKAADTVARDLGGDARLLEEVGGGKLVRDGFSFSFDRSETWRVLRVDPAEGPR